MTEIEPPNTPHSFSLPSLVFLTLLGSYAFFWHARDWNVSSRLMLTYALGDRGTVQIDGLEDHTRDRARVGRHFYSDKAPGYSLTALPVYLAVRAAGMPAHPVYRPGNGFTHWPADYWVTLGTSGLATALAGALLVRWALYLSAAPFAAALVGLSYGLSTPAYAYATLAYGHQLCACCHVAAFGALWAAPRSRYPAGLAALAGLLTAWGAVVELQTGVIAALLAAYALGLVLSGRLKARSLGLFAVAAIGPALILVSYNVLAFGSPLSLGYFHEDIREFRELHSRDNPLGLRSPDLTKAGPLLWGQYRGLLWYAPIVVLAVPGWIMMWWRGQRDLMVVSSAVVVAVFLVNLSYPEWTGGWSTGPRLLTPLLPFAMLGVAGLLTTRYRAWTTAALVLALVGFLGMLLFQGVGGRVPHTVERPWTEAVLPTWRGQDTEWGRGGAFDRTIAAVAFPAWVAKLPPGRAWFQFLPLLAFQATMFGAITATALRPGRRQTRVPETR